MRSEVGRRRLDRAILLGWLFFQIVGQWLLPFPAPALQAAAVLWLLGGMLMIRKIWCLPLLILTLPAFQCEIHRPWAWVQVLAAAVFLGRVLFSEKLSRRDLALVIGVALLVGFFSLPADHAVRLEELRLFDRIEVLRQFLRPEAVWAVFSYRQAFDRMLIALLALALWRGRGYFSSPRIALAFVCAGVLAVVPVYTASLLPWQKPHLFLGTTNFGSFGLSVAHGAGYNRHYFSFLFALGIAWSLTLPSARYRKWLFACAPLLIPALWIEQRAFFLAVLASVFLIAVFSCFRRFRPAIRRRFRRGIRGGAGPRILFALLMFVNLAWLSSLDLGDEQSPARLALYRQAYNYTALVSPRLARSLVGGAGPKVPEWEDAPSGRLYDHIRSVDPARAHAWYLAWRQALAGPLWRGAGAGSWARFHRESDRISLFYLAHVHNTYLDLLFEYGLFLCFLAAVAAVSALSRVIRGVAFGRLHLPFIVSLALLAAGQHLLYAFTTQVALLPALVLFLRSLFPASPACRLLSSDPVSCSTGARPPNAE